MDKEYKLKKGDLVVMHTCGEAELPESKGKVWRCQTDQWNRGEGVYEQTLVLLEGYSGGFETQYLKKIMNKELNWIPYKSKSRNIESHVPFFVTDGTKVVTDFTHQVLRGIDGLMLIISPCS